jgi:hypothetical protein
MENERSSSFSSRMCDGFQEGEAMEVQPYATRASVLKKVCGVAECLQFLSTVSSKPSESEDEYRWGKIIDGTDGSCVASGVTSDHTPFIEGSALDEVKDLAHLPVIIIVADLGRFLNALVKKQISNIEPIHTWLQAKCDKKLVGPHWGTQLGNFRAHATKKCERAIAAKVAHQKKSSTLTPEWIFRGRENGFMDVIRACTILRDMAISALASNFRMGCQQRPKVHLRRHSYPITATESSKLVTSSNFKDADKPDLGLRVRDTHIATALLEDATRCLRGSSVKAIIYVRDKVPDLPFHYLIPA